MDGPGWFRRRSARVLAVACLVVAVVPLGAGPASANAVLESADPAIASVVATAPTIVRLNFSEAVDLGADAVDVLGPDGRALRTGAARLDPQADQSVLVPLRGRLAAGTYIVKWHLVTRDGHPSVGEYRFAVRAPSEPLTAATQGGSGPPLLAAAGRALAAGGGLALVGLAGFPLLVLGPARRRLSEPVAAVLDAAALARLGRPANSAAAVAALGTFLVLASTTATVSGGSALAELLRPDRVISAATATRTGTTLLLRIAAIAATISLLALIRRRQQAGGATTPLAAGAGLTVGALVLTFSLVSHAATEPDRVVAVGLDVVHLLAAGVWAGGLIAMALVALPAARQASRVSPDGPADAAGAVAGRFSVVAQGAMVVVLGTGAYAALVRVTALNDLGTAWGQDLVVKLSLWVTVLLVASGNAFFVMPALADRASRRTSRRAAAGQLASSVRLELGLAAGLVVVAGLLSATTLPAQAQRIEGIESPSVTTVAATGSGYRIDVQAVRRGRGAGVATVFGVSLTTEGTAASAPGASATLRGKDGVVRGLALDLVEEGRWTSRQLAVPPGRYRMTVQVDRTTGSVRIPVTVRVG